LPTQYHQHEDGITVRDWQQNIIGTKLASQHEAGNTPSQHEAGNTSSQHEVGTHLHNTRLAHHHSMRLAHHQHKAGITTLLRLSREVLMDYTKLISKVLKLYTR
jgi:hypothetical protein